MKAALEQRNERTCLISVVAGETGAQSCVVARHLFSEATLIKCILDAMAASGLTEDLKQQLECPVCLEEFKEPKVLPCQHSFCKTCLEGVLVQDKDGNWIIPCPSCRKVVEISSGNVESLQPNFFVNNLISLVAHHDSNSQAKKLECENCVGGDPAVSRCTSCCLYLCEFCEESHRRARKTNSHKLMSVSEVKLEGATCAVVQPSTCEEHEGEKLKLFCENCDKAICRDCTIVEHRDHKYVFAKDAYAKKVEGLREVLQVSKARITVWENAVKAVEEMMAQVRNTAEDSEETIQDTFCRAVAKLKDRFNDLLSDINKVKLAKTKELETQKEELEAAIASVQSSIAFTEQAIKDGSQVSLLQMIPQMTSRLKNLSSATWQLQPCIGDICELQVDECQLHEEICVHIGPIKADQTSASLSTVSMGNGEEGLMYSTLCNQPIKFQIVVRDCRDKKSQEGGDLIQVAVQVPGQQDAFVIDEVTNNGDGTYTFTFKPRVTGQHHLSVKVNEQDVRGAPLVWNVESWTLTQVSTSIATSFADGNATAKSTRACNQSISGSRGFSTGQHLWQVKVCTTFGYVAAGIVLAEQKAKGNSCWNYGNQWMLSHGQKYQPSIGFSVQSRITTLATDDVLELLLDCDQGKLTIFNRGSKQSDCFEGFQGEIFPAFFLYYPTESVSLLV